MKHSMSLEEKLAMYREAKENMPNGTKAIVLFSNIKDLDCRERRAFEESIEYLIGGVQDWRYTFTLFGQTGLYSHCAINPYTTSDKDVERILGNLPGTHIEYYR